MATTYTINNVSKQVVKISISKGTRDIGDVPKSKSGSLSIAPQASVTLEASRVNEGQLANLRRRKLITATINIGKISLNKPCSCQAFDSVDAAQSGLTLQQKFLRNLFGRNSIMIINRGERSFTQGSGVILANMGEFGSGSCTGKVRYLAITADHVVSKKTAEVLDDDTGKWSILRETTACIEWATTDEVKRFIKNVKKRNGEAWWNRLTENQKWTVIVNGGGGIDPMSLRCGAALVGDKWTARVNSKGNSVVLDARYIMLVGEPNEFTDIQTGEIERGDCIWATGFPGGDRETRGETAPLFRMDGEEDVIKVYKNPVTWGDPRARGGNQVQDQHGYDLGFTQACEPDVDAGMSGGGIFNRDDAWRIVGIVGHEVVNRGVQRPNARASNGGVTVARYMKETCTPDEIADEDLQDAYDQLSDCCCVSAENMTASNVTIEVIDD